MLKAAYFEEKMYREVEKVEEGSHKKGRERTNLFDFFDFTVKILPHLAVSRNYGSYMMLLWELCHRCVSPGTDAMCRHSRAGRRPASTISWVLSCKTHSPETAWMPFLGSARDRSGNTGSPEGAEELKRIARSPP
jgi:hypothetical protein